MSISRSAWSAAAVTVALAALLPASPASAATTECTGPMTGTIAGDVHVPASQVCHLLAATVLGNITSDAGSDLLLIGSTVNGSIRSTSAGFQIQTSTVRGTVTHANAGDMVLIFASIDGRLIALNNHGSELNVDHTTVGQTSLIAGNQEQYRIVLRADDFRGSLHFDFNHAVGAGFHTIFQTTIAGDLACFGNVPAPILAMNTVGGRRFGQCA